MHRRPALFLIAVLLSVPLFGRIAGEVPAGPPVYGPAAGNQTTPVIGSDGQNFLSVWTDGREGQTELYAARFNSDGVLLDSTDIRIAASSAAVNRYIVAVFSIQKSWVILWSEQTFLPNAPGPASNVMVVRLDSDGHIFDGPRVAIPDAYPTNWRNAATNGSRILVAYNNQYAVLDQNAVLLHRDLSLPVTSTMGMIVASNGSEFMIAWGIPSGTMAVVQAIRVDADGKLILWQQFTIGTELPVAAASDGTDYLVVTQDWTNRRFLARTATAQVQALATATALPSVIGIPNVTGDLVWNGSVYVFTTGTTVEMPSATYEQTFGLRLDRTGQPLDSEPFPLSDTTIGATGQATIAALGSQLGSVWSSLGETSGIDTFAIVVDAASLHRSNPILLSRSANLQTNPSLGFSGRNYLLAWQETTGTYIGRFSADGQPLDGRGIQIARWGEDPRVVFDNRNYVVGWITNSNSLSTLWIDRVSPDGQTLDGDGIPLATSPCRFSFDLLNAGGRMIAAWDECGYKSIWIQPLNAMNRPLGTPLAITPRQMATATPRLAWNGNEIVVVFQEQIPIPSILLCPGCQSYRSNVRAVRVTSGLTVLDTAPLPVAVSDSGDQNQPYVASNGDGFLAGWTLRGSPYPSSSEVTLREIAADGSLGTTSSVAVGGLSSIIWDGFHYQLAYANGNPFMTHFGLGDRWAINATSDAESMPTLVATGNGNSSAAYVRVATEPLYGGVARVFMRDPTTTRTRPVRNP